MTGSARATIFIDNDRVRVTEYRFQPGENTGWHRHGEFGTDADEEKYIHLHPGAHPDMVPWLLKKRFPLQCTGP